MRRLRASLYRLGGFIKRRSREAEMAEEIRAHLEGLAVRHEAAGLSPEEAGYVAARQFGNVVEIKERAREQRTVAWLEALGRDIRFAARNIGNHPGFASMVLLMLALCIGANTAIFSLVYSFLLKPLPFPGADRIVEFRNFFDGRTFNSNLDQYVDYRTNAVSYEAVGLWRFESVTVGGEESAERAYAVSCTAEMFEILGVKPVIGQFFTLAADRFGAGHVVVLGDSYWKAHFNSNAGVLGATLRIDGEPYRIIGVAPPAIEAIDARVRFILPLQWKASWIHPTERYAFDTSLFARLKTAVSLKQAQAEATVIERRYYDIAPAWQKGILDRASYRIAVEPERSERVQQIRAPLSLLQAGVVLVLLIGCVNIAGLLLARANSRQSELSIRLALGASRGAIARQFLMESFVLVIVGAGLGAAGAFGVVHAAGDLSAEILPGLRPAETDGHVLAFTVAVSLVVGVLISLLPAMHVMRSALGMLLPGASRIASNGRRVRRLSGLLITAQVAVTFVLMVGAGLLVHSFANAIAIKPGFDPANLMTARIALGRQYWNEHGAEFQEQFVQALEGIPGVTNVALASGVPFEGALDSRVLTLRDSPLLAGSAQPKASEMGVSVGYFRTLHIRLLEGRFFNERDKDGREYIVDERFAHDYFPGHSAVGAHFTFQNRDLPTKTDNWPVIVGVVQNVPYYGAESRSDAPCSYFPILNTQPEELSLFVRSRRPLADMTAAVRAKLHGLDPEIPLYHFEMVQGTIHDSFDGRRAVMVLSACFAGLALFLSAVGLYGVLAYDVSSRTRELGIRSAIGASPRQAVGLILRQGMWKTVVGLALGLAGAIYLTNFLRSQLFDLSPNDPISYAVGLATLPVVTLVASWLPARRAARVDPVVALRAE